MRAGQISLLLTLLAFQATSCKAGNSNAGANEKEWISDGRIGATSPLADCRSANGCFAARENFPLLYVQVISSQALMLGLADSDEIHLWRQARLVAIGANSIPAQAEVDATGLSRSTVGFSADHRALNESRVYLLLTEPLQAGVPYRLVIPEPGQHSPQFQYHDQQVSPALQVSQVGFWPGARKRALAGHWLGTMGPLPLDDLPFEVIDETHEAIVYTGQLEAMDSPDPLSGQLAAEADFSSLRTPGRYRLRVPGVGSTRAFQIDATVYEPIFHRLFRVFYHQRNSTAIKAPWAEEGFERPGGIPTSLSARIHPAVSNSRLAHGERAESYHAVAKGWFDAGDYGQYVANAASVWYAFGLGFDLLPAAFSLDDLDIPESGNGVPDFIDELEWGASWLLDMQDVRDGGVYSRLAPVMWDTTLPHEVSEPRYLFEKTTHATAAFAAAVSIHARLVRPFDPDRATRLVSAARAAWDFLQGHEQWPGEGERYRNPPGVHAGEYSDASARDNRMWAAAELFRTTGEQEFLKAAVQLVPQVKVDNTNAVSYAAFGLAAYWSLLQSCPVEEAGLTETVCHQLRTTIEVGADWQLARSAENPWGAPLHPHAPYIGWGAFGHSSRAVLPVLQAWRLTGDDAYAARVADLVQPELGLNPMSLSFITGVGYNWPRFPLTKFNRNGAIGSPLPGLPVNGPHFHLPALWPAMQAVNEAYLPPETDGLAYPPLLRYVDANLLPPMSEPTVSELAVATVAYALLSEASRLPPFRPTSTD